MDEIREYLQLKKEVEKLKKEVDETLKPFSDFTKETCLLLTPELLEKILLLQDAVAEKLGEVTELRKIAKKIPHELIKLEEDLIELDTKLREFWWYRTRCAQR